MIFRLLIAFNFLANIFASDLLAEDKSIVPQILFVGFTPGEPYHTGLEINELIQMTNVHTLERHSSDSYVNSIEHKCKHHQVDWLDKKKWDDFVTANEQKFDLVIFDQRVAHHFAGIENFGSTLEGETCSAPEGIHANFYKLLAHKGRVYVPICEVPFGKASNPSQIFTSYVERIKDHFISCGLVLYALHKSEEVKSILNTTELTEGIDARDIVYLRNFLGKHPFLQRFFFAPQPNDDIKTGRPDFILLTLTKKASEPGE